MIPVAEFVSFVKACNNTFSINRVTKCSTDAGMRLGSPSVAALQSTMEGFASGIATWEEGRKEGRKEGREE